MNQNEQPRIPPPTHFEYQHCFYRLTTELPRHEACQAGSRGDLVQDPSVWPEGQLVFICQTCQQPVPISRVGMGICT